MILDKIEKNSSFVHTLIQKQSPKNDKVGFYYLVCTPPLVWPTLQANDK